MNRCGIFLENFADRVVILYIRS